MKKILNIALVISIITMGINTSLAKKSNLSVTMPDEEIVNQIRNDKAQALGNKKIAKNN